MMRNWLMALAVASLCLADVRAQVGLPVAAATTTTTTEIENLKLQIELLKKAREVLHAQEELKQVQDEMRAVRDKVTDAAVREKELTDRVAALQEAKTKADAALARDQEKLSATAKQLQAREAELRNVRKELSAQKESVARLESELSIEKNVSEMSVKRANAVQKALAEAKTASAALAKEKAELETASATLAKEKAELETASAALAKEKAELETASAALAKEKAELETRLAQTRADLEKTVQELEAQKQAAAETATKTQNLQNALQDQEKSATARQEQESQSKQELERQLAEARAAHELAAGELAEAKKAVEELSAKVRQLEGGATPASGSVSVTISPDQVMAKQKGPSAAEVQELKARVADLEQQVAKAGSEAERLTRQDLASRHCVEGFAYAQKKKWLPCLEAWKAAVDAGYRPEADSAARACMKQALTSGLEESESQMPTVAGASQGLAKLSLASHGEALRAVYAEILGKIGAGESVPQESDK